MAPELMNPMPGWSHTCVLERLTLGSSCTPRLLARYVFFSSAHISRSLTVYTGAIWQRQFGPSLDQPPPLFGSHRCPAIALHLSDAFHVLSIAVDPAIHPLPLSPPSPPQPPLPLTDILGSALLVFNFNSSRDVSSTATRVLNARTIWALDPRPLVPR